MSIWKARKRLETGALLIAAALVGSFLFTAANSAQNNNNVADEREKLVGEWTGAEEGLGVYMIGAMFSLQADRLWTAVALVSTISASAYGYVALIEHLAIPRELRSGEMPAAVATITWVRARSSSLNDPLARQSVTSWSPGRTWNSAGVRRPSGTSLMHTSRCASCGAEAIE